MKLNWREQKIYNLVEHILKKREVIKKSTKVNKKQKNENEKEKK